MFMLLEGILSTIFGFMVRWDILLTIKDRKRSIINRFVDLVYKKLKKSLDYEIVPYFSNSINYTAYILFNILLDFISFYLSSWVGWRR